MRRALAVWLLLAGPAAAQVVHEDPDWPCVQRLVPVLGAAAYWGGPEPAEGTSWRADPAVAALVAAASPRGITEERGTALIEAYLAGLPAEARPAAAARVMEGLTEETNRERSAVIERLRALTRRQRGVGERASRLTAQMRALPPDAPERADLLGQRTLTIREFDEVERTLGFACEAPVALEARLGAYARALMEGQEP